MGRNWTEEEMLATVYLYRFGRDSLGMEIIDIAEVLGRSTGAVECRLLDLQAIDTPEKGPIGFGRSVALTRVWVQNKNLSQDVLREKVFGFLSVRNFWVPGRPATFATRGEDNWKKALLHELRECPGCGAVGIIMDFFLRDLTPHGQPLDVDNLCELVISSLVGKLGWFGGKLTNIKWWRARKIQAEESGLRMIIGTESHPCLPDGVPIFQGIYTGKLPVRATEPEVAEWVTTMMNNFSCVVKTKVFISLQFMDTKINIGDIATGKVKALVDCLFPLLGGSTGRPER